jgi:hypothetical protein
MAGERWSEGWIGALVKDVNEQVEDSLDLGRMVSDCEEWGSSNWSVEVHGWRLARKRVPARPSRCLDMYLSWRRDNIIEPRNARTLRIRTRDVTRHLSMIRIC